MKKIILTVFCAIIGIIIYSLNKNVLSYSNGAPTGSTNAPGEKTCATNMLCHSGTPNNGTGGTILITMENISGGYMGGVTYKIMPYVNQSGSAKIGFQTVALLSDGNSAGTVTIMNSKTQMNAANGKEYVTHTASGNTNIALHDWMYEWTAPPQGSGTVTVYGAFIASNNDMTASGDSIYTDSLVIFESGTGEREWNSGNMEFKIYTTIIKDDLAIHYFTSESFTGEYSIYSIDGKLKESGNVNFNSGENSFHIKNNYYSNGIYILNIKCCKIEKVNKILYFQRS